MPMISLKDVRWSNMTGGYRTPFDPRRLLRRLETDSDTKEVWQQLWDELHHQGDVGDASFASVPFLVKSHQQRAVPDWNTYAIVAIIELARKKGENPDVPQWIEDDYSHAIRKLAEIATTEVLRAETADEVRAMLGIIAIAMGLPIHGELLVKYSEDELSEIDPNP